MNLRGAVGKSADNLAGEQLRACGAEPHVLAFVVPSRIPGQRSSHLHVAHFVKWWRDFVRLIPDKTTLGRTDSIFAPWLRTRPEAVGEEARLK
jgi:hypothetical protein